MIIRKIKGFINKYSEKKAVVLVITCAVIVLYILFMVYFISRPTPHVLYRNDAEADSTLPFGLILHDNAVVQEFTFHQDAAVHNIRLRLANYMSIRRNINQVYIYINDILVHGELIDSSVVIDNAFYPLSAMDVHVSEGDIMRIVITSSDGVPHEAITIWTRPDFVSDNRLLRYNMVDGTYEELPGEIIMRIFSTDQRTFIQRLSERLLDISTVWIPILFGAIMVLTILIFVEASKEVRDEESD